MRSCRKWGNAVAFVSRVRSRHLIRAIAVLAAFGWGLATVPSARASGYAPTLLHSFGAVGDGTNPIGAALIIDANGNLYGTTPGGGAYGYGTVFELVKSSGTYSEKVLYSFADGGDGGFPSGGVLIDASGNLYGTTSFGGASGLGTVFELVNSSGTYSETVLHSFTGGADGQVPNGGLVKDASGNLYGVTYNNSYSAFDGGAVFELVNSSGTYTEKVPHSFTHPTGPIGPPVIDASGNFYFNALTTTFPGDNGSVYELVNTSGTYTEKVLHSFTGSPDGSGPNGSLLMDASGNLYGATGGGGSNNNGTAFELVNSSGTYSESILHSFAATTTDAGTPNGGLIMDASGNLYGTGVNGGNQLEGTVFELVKSSGTYTVKLLHSFFFFCANDGEQPQSGLLMDALGNLYGTTSGGGSSLNYGTVFELVSFTGQAAATTTALTSSLNPATAGDPVTLTATVTSNSNSSFLLSGTVTISNGSLVLGSAPLVCSGSTQLMLEDADAMGIGLNTITAKFTPDTAAFAPSIGMMSEIVNESGVVLTSGNNTLTGNQTIDGNESVNGNMAVASLTIGGGTPITQYNSATFTMAVPSLEPGACTTKTYTWSAVGSGTNDTIALGVPNPFLSAGGVLSFQAWESASNTLKIRACNVDQEGPPSRSVTDSIRVDLIKH